MATMNRPSSDLDPNVHEAAAAWYARMSSDLKTPDDQDAFDRWIASAPENADAYAETCALAGRFDAVADHPALAQLRVETQLLEERARRPLLSRIGAVWPGVGLAAAAAVAAMLYFNPAPPETGAWTTARGETRDIALSDGTKITLGSDSRLDMTFQTDRRNLDLARGQAFFDVAHDADRPFVVAVHGRTVTALGTAFDVRSYLDETTVTLVSGKVEIARPGERGEAILAPGQQFHASAGVSSVRDVDAAVATAWRTGILEFDGVTLTQAITDFNRSAPQSIMLADPRLADLRVSGVFRANDPHGFAAALVPAYPVTATRQSSGDVILTYREDDKRRAPR